MERLLARFRSAHTQVLGVSVDSVYCHANWGQSMGGISFPLLADFHPKGAMASEYGLYLSDKGITVNACHPGDVNSKLSNDLGYGGHESPDQGARTPVWLASDDAVAEVSGCYFERRAQVHCPFGASADDQRTPDLSDVVQEIVSGEEWVEGNAVAFVIEGKRIAHC